MIKAEEIEKYNGIVQEKFPASTIRRINPQKIVWIHNGLRVAEIDEDGGGVIFRYLQKDSFEQNPFAHLLK